MKLNTKKTITFNELTFEANETELLQKIEITKKVDDDYESCGMFVLHRKAYSKNGLKVNEISNSFESFKNYCKSKLNIVDDNAIYNVYTSLVIE